MIYFRFNIFYIFFFLFSSVALLQLVAIFVVCFVVSQRIDFFSKAKINIDFFVSNLFGKQCIFLVFCWECLL